MTGKIELESLGIPAEFHLYLNIRHDFELRIGTSADGWIKDAVRFWKNK